MWWSFIGNVINNIISNIIQDNFLLFAFALHWKSPTGKTRQQVGSKTSFLNWDEKSVIQICSTSLLLKWTTRKDNMSEALSLSRARRITDSDFLSELTETLQRWHVKNLSKKSYWSPRSPPWFSWSTTLDTQGILVILRAIAVDPQIQFAIIDLKLVIVNCNAVLLLTGVELKG